MSFALLIIGITLIVAAVRDTQGTLVALIYADFTGPANFWYWIAAILIVGAVGYIPRLKPLSDGFLIVILLVLVLKRGDPTNPEIKGGLFEEFMRSLKGTDNPNVTAGSKPGGIGGIISDVVNTVTGNKVGAVPPATQGTGPNGSWTTADKIGLGELTSCPPGMVYQGPRLGCR